MDHHCQCKQLTAKILSDLPGQEIFRILTEIATCPVDHPPITEMAETNYSKLLVNELSKADYLESLKQYLTDSEYIEVLDQGKVTAIIEEEKVTANIEEGNVTEESLKTICISNSISLFITENGATERKECSWGTEIVIGPDRCFDGRHSDSHIDKPLPTNIRIIIAEDGKGLKVSESCSDRPYARRLVRRTLQLVVGLCFQLGDYEIRVAELEPDLKLCYKVSGQSEESLFVRQEAFIHSHLAAGPPEHSKFQIIKKGKQWFLTPIEHFELYQYFYKLQSLNQSEGLTLTLQPGDTIQHCGLSIDFKQLN